MHFDSFEQALQVCVNAEPDSEEQEAALRYCLENAPPELREQIAAAMNRFHQGGHSHGPGCGCGGHHDS